MVSYVGNSLYIHANGGCYRCGRGDTLVDMDVQIVGEGALALCRGCIGDAAEALELTFNEAHVRELRARVQELEIEVVNAKASELAFTSALNTALEAAAQAAEPTAACVVPTKAGAACKGTPVAGTDRCMSHS